MRSLSFHRGGFTFSAASMFAVIVCVGEVAHAQDCGPSWTPAFEVDQSIYPFAHRCVELEHGILHYIDEGPIINPAGTVLMLHGNPTWSFVFRDVIIDLLADDYRVIAPDYYGFGLSDRPEPAAFAYSARAHAEAMSGFVEALDIQNATLLMHDWGGTIGFAMARESPQRFTSAVVLNAWAWPIAPERRPLFHDFIEWVGTNVRYSEYMVRSGILPRTVGENLAALHGAPGSPEYLAVRDGYWAPFLDVQTGRPLSREHMLPTNQLYHVYSDPMFPLIAEEGVRALADRPVAFVIGARDDLLGALRCNFEANPPCPDGASCRTVDGMNLCIDDDTLEAIFPALDEFLMRWNPDQVRQITLSRTSTHYVPEYEAEAVADAVRAVN